MRPPKIISLAAWVVLMAAYWLMLARLVLQTHKRTDPFPYGLSLGILGATSSFFVSSLVHYDFGDSVVMFLFWFLAGLALALYHQLHQNKGTAVSTGATA